MHGKNMTGNRQPSEKPHHLGNWLEGGCGHLEKRHTLPKTNMDPENGTLNSGSMLVFSGRYSIISCCTGELSKIGA